MSVGDFVPWLRHHAKVNLRTRNHGFWLKKKSRTCIWVDKYVEHHVENPSPTFNRLDVLSMKSGNHT